jgi:outer membrane receptor protein involved in Fe transport
LLQRSFWLASAALAVVASPALAQQPPAKPAPPAAKPAENTVGEVRVEGTAPPVRTSIDRRSYSVANDLQATTGSISDALRNVPSVEVDVNGNVSLRGDSNVTILVDGKPSGAFKGEGKGQALQSLGADRIERVEVITNPSAAFNPEGSAGIINLITKKTAGGVGYTGSVRVNVGSAGRQNVSASGSNKIGKVTLSGDLHLRHESQTQDGRDARATLDPATGGFRRSVQATHGTGAVDIVNLRGGLDYDPDPRTRISVELDYRGFDFKVRNPIVFNEVSPSGVLVRSYDRIGPFTQTRPYLELTVSYRKKWGPDHELFASFSRERVKEDRDRPITVINRLPVPGQTFENLVFDGLYWGSDGKVDYSQPFGETKLKVGYAYERIDNDYDNRGFRGAMAETATPDASLTNLFLFDQTVHGVYATAERPVGGKFTALAGLRVESTEIDIDQATQAITASNDYVRAYPSLHLRYELSDTQQLSASYSRRIARPQPSDYNPFRIYSDPKNFRQGNPALKPTTTDSFEAGYQFRKQGQIYLATGYYREVHDAVNDVTQDLGDNVFLTTRQNVGQSRSAGLELVANGRFTRKLTYNVSGNAFWSEIDGTGLGFGAGKRDAVTATGRANLNWQLTDKDFLQVNGFLNGKRLTPQGYVQPTGMLNMGYRHKFSDKLSGVITAQDVLSTFQQKTVIDTPALKAVQRFEPRIRGVYLGLTYTFGGRQRDPGFDYGGGGGGPPS